MDTGSILRNHLLSLFQIYTTDKFLYAFEFFKGYRFESRITLYLDLYFLRIDWLNEKISQYFTNLLENKILCVSFET